MGSYQRVRGNGSKANLEVLNHIFILIIKPLLKTICVLLKWWISAWRPLKDPTHKDYDLISLSNLTDSQGYSNLGRD